MANLDNVNEDIADVDIANPDIANPEIANSQTMKLHNLTRHLSNSKILRNLGCSKHQFSVTHGTKHM